MLYQWVFTNEVSRDSSQSQMYEMPKWISSTLLLPVFFETCSFVCFQSHLFPMMKEMRGRLCFWLNTIRISCWSLRSQKMSAVRKSELCLIHFVLWIFHRSSRSQQTSGWRGGWVGGSALWYGVTLPWTHMNSSWNAHFKWTSFPASKLVPLDYQGQPLKSGLVFHTWQTKAPGVNQDRPL